MADQVELVESLVTDRHGTRARVGICLDPHRQAEELLKMALDGCNIGILGALPAIAGAAGGLALSASTFAEQFFDLAYRQPLIDRSLGQIA